MSEKSKPNLNEMINSAGDGSGLQLPPAFVMVNPKQHRKYKKGNQDKVDGRTKGARSLFDRIQKRKMKEETNVTEALSTDTERAQKQITQSKKLSPWTSRGNRQSGALKRARKGPTEDVLSHLILFPKAKIAISATEGKHWASNCSKLTQCLATQHPHFTPKSMSTKKVSTTKKLSTPKNLKKRLQRQK